MLAAPGRYAPAHDAPRSTMSAQQHPQPTPTAPGRPPLRRPREGRILAGVAAGLADHLGWDVALVRLLVVVGTLVTQGLGLLVYLVAALLIPAAEPDAPRPVATRAGAQVGGRPPLFWLGVGLLVVGGWWLLAVTPMRFGLFPGVSLGSLAAPLLLIGLGLALWVTGDRDQVAGPRADRPGAPPPAFAPAAARTSATTAAAGTPVTSPQESPMETTVPSDTTATGPTSGSAASAGWGQPPAGDHGDRTSGPGAVPPGPPPQPPAAGGQGGDWTPPPAPDRDDHVLGRATVGLMLVTVGILWTLRLAGVLTIGFGQLLAAALLVVGIGLLVGAVAGRGRGLIWLGVVLLPFVLVAQVSANGWMGPVPMISTDSTAAGELRLTPTDLDELESSYELGAGSMRLDLTQLPWDGEAIDLEISVGAGEVRVTVPDDIDVAAEGSVGIGQIRILDRSAGGLGVGDISTTVEVEDPRGSLQLDLSAGLGEIRVEQAPARVGAGG